MAFSASQRKQHIMELQTYLHAIALMDSDIPAIVPDGVYSQETAAAVKAFQRKYGLPQTGAADPATWNSIVSVYRKYLTAAPVAYAAFPSAAYVAHKGEHGQLIYIIQAMLMDISRRYDNAPRVDVCGDYDDATAVAVKRFQQWCGVPQSGDVDSGTWNLLVSCCEHISHTGPK
ncbi:MAG: peptidoglycan-binding protein [Ruminococcus sp.]|nr:peptidoglycan-binding protein [Ruminococcus sp.]